MSSFAQQYRRHLLAFVFLTAVSLIGAHSVFQPQPSITLSSMVQEQIPKVITVATISHTPSSIPDTPAIQYSDQTVSDSTLTTTTEVTTSEQSAPIPVEEMSVRPVQTFLTIENRTYAVNVAQDSTIYDVMIQAQKENSDFTFQSKNYGDLGQFIESINNRKNNLNEQLYWTLYINDKRSSLGASNYTVQNGDRMQWKYENIHKY